jgi:hypothetical protein
MKNDNSRLKIFLVFVFFAITKFSFSQSIYTNPITGADPSNNAPYTTGQTVATGITVSGLDLSGGVNNADATDRFSADDWTTSGNINLGDYFSWTITPGNCYDLDFTNLVLAFQRSGNGPQNLALRSSVDGYAANIWTFNLTNTNAQNQTISLASASFQNLTSAITFRLYGWNAGNNNGTFSVNSFTFNGAVTSTNTAVAGTISGINSVCSGSNTTLTVSGNTGNIQWQTSTNNTTFTNIGGATSATYTTPNITTTTYYRAGSTVGSCPTLYSTSYAVTMAPTSMTAVGATACGPTTVNLAVNQVCPPSGSTTNWYAATTGGTPLGTGNTFTTPVLNSTTTYYANSTFNTGASLSTTDRSGTNQRGLRFNALAPFVLNSVQISTNAAGSITLELRDNLNQPVAALVYTATAGTNTVPLGWTIPAGTGYRIIKTAGTPQLSRTDPFTFPIGTAGVVSITSSEDNGTVENGRYFYFYNWNVSTTRIPVVATINATVSDVTTSACGSYTWAANGVTYNASGIYFFVGPCNTAQLDLTITPNTGNTTTASACGSYTWSVNGQTYTSSGTYTSVTGCFTETLVLTITPNTTPTATVTACDSYTWSVNGQTYTTSGTYTSVSGCATNTLVLTINTSSSSTSALTACAPYVWPVNGQSYSASGTYTAVNGCQTQNLDLTISTPSVTAVGATACAPAAVNLAVSQVCQPVGSTTNWYAASAGGSSLGTGNSYTTPVLSTTTTYYASNNFTAGAALSTGDRSGTNNRGLRFNALVPFLLNSVQINTNGAGSITLELRDNLNQPVAGTAAVVFNAAGGTNTVPLGWTIPAGTGYRIIKTAGTPQLSRTDPFTFPIGTAGIVSITSSENNGAVENGRYFYFYNWNISTPRIPVVATINTPTLPTFTQVSAICSGETLNALPTTSNNSITGTWSPSLNNTATTTYTFTPTAGQCASTASMTITVNPVLTASVSISAAAPGNCPGVAITLTAVATNGGSSPSYVWMKNGVVVSGQNNATFTSGSFANGDVITCEMTSNATPCLVGSPATSNSVTIVLNPIVTPTFTQVSAICSGETLNELPTTSNNSITGTWSPALNNTATTTYTFTPTASQCASTETMTITVNPLTNNTTTASVCDSYTWAENGTTYTTSGTYTSVTGCHSETLVLTITPSTNNTTTASACDSYTWSVNGTTYTASGTYTSVTGCSTETLVLTVNTSSVYYLDADGDGFGSATTANFCSMPSTGYASNNTDCNDAVATTYPGAAELCNGVDDNCSGFADEGCPSTIAGEEPSNSILAPSGMYSYCSSFYGTLAGAFPSAAAQSSCVTGEDVWYNFVALSSGTTIFIGSYVNDIVIELQDANGNLIEVENTVNGPGTEVLTTTNLIAGQEYRIGIRNNNGVLNPGGAFSACVRHLRRGGADSGTSATWPSTLSTCSLFKASYCGGTGVQYRYTWTGLTGTAAGQVFTRTQTSDYLNVTAVTPSLHAGSTYNVLVTAIYTIPNGAGVNEVVELASLAPSTITISPVSNVALRSADQLSNGPRYRGSVVAALPWVCGVTNWRWRFTEVNPLTLQTVGLPIEQNRAAASNYINLNTVTALQYGKTYAVQSSPVFSYTGSNYQWGPVTYMAIIGSAGLIVDASQDVSQGASQDSPKDAMQDSSQEIELNVYPNPSNGSGLNLNISGIESDNVQVKVYDALGRKIESKRYVIDGTLQTTLNFANELSNGLYILEVNTEDVTRSVRFMVEQ